MTRRAWAVPAVALLSLVAVDEAAAHGLGGIRDLPVPGWLFLVGGGTVLVVSFLALGLLWREPRLDASGGTPGPGWLQWLLLSSWVRVPVRLVSVGVFVLVWSASALGTERASQNLAPTFVYVVFWVGMAITVVALGNVWSVLDPWRSVADGVAWAGARLGIRGRERPYPRWLGIWPAALLLLLFTLLELAYHDPANPRMIAIAITIYSVATWSGMAVFGRETWGRNGDGFRVYFDFLSRAALFGTRKVGDRDEVVVRKPLSKLAEIETRRGVVAFFAIMLGTVAFDGLSRSTWWLDQRYEIETSFANPVDAERFLTLVNVVGLLLVVLFVAGAYMGAVKVAERMIGDGVSLYGVFVFSLVPIAFVYALSHYFSLLIVQGQFAIPLLSDPFGGGRDLLGTAGYEPKLDVFSPNTIWYIQVVALVVGHVAALVVAHDRAVATTPSPRLALRTQYAMLALMVLYTVGGMWLLSIG
ncbi:MAG: hypothetical protein R6W48_13085 [Gaiellaceae bacterium]